MSEKSESEKIFRCKICEKNYATASSLCNHNKKFHKSDINSILQPVNILESDIKLYHCKYCTTKYKHQQSKFRHEQTCNNKPNLTEENNLLKQELSEIKNKLAIFVNKQAKVHPKTLQKLINNTNNTNIITTNTNSNNTINNTNNITIKFGSENLAEVLTDKEMQIILSRCRKSIEESNFQKKIYIFFEKVISYN